MKHIILSVCYFFVAIILGVLPVAIFFALERTYVFLIILIIISVLSICFFVTNLLGNRMAKENEERIKKGVGRKKWIERSITEKIIIILICITGVGIAAGLGSAMFIFLIPAF